MIDSQLFEDRLFTFLIDILDPDRLDYVLCVERKATALIRALLDLSNRETRWDWGRVLSSDALEFLPSGFLNGKHVLVFNEMIHTGQSTKKAISSLLQNSPMIGQLETAAFVVHGDFKERGVWRTQDFRQAIDAESPDFAVHRSASPLFYATVREQLIAMLRNKGALMLDTEHLETTFQLTMPFREFCDGLNAFGQAVEYEDDDSRAAFPGVTIRDPVVDNIEGLSRTLPAGTDLLANSPRKLRLVRRGPSEFAFIPIWYPPVPAVNMDSYMTSAFVPAYVQPAIRACPAESRPTLVFHLASLVASLELIRTAWAGIAPLVGKGVRPNFLGADDAANALGHLRALYPLLDFGKLQESLDEGIATYQNNETVKRVHAATNWRPRSRDQRRATTYVRAETRQALCRQLFAELIRSRDRFSVEEDWFEDDDDASEQPDYTFTWSEFWSMGESLNIDEDTRTILMDTVIDNAIVKTSERTVARDGGTFLERAYQPDSEFARLALRRMAYGAEEVLSSGH